MRAAAFDPDELTRSVIAIPPLAWTADLRLDGAQNRALFEHMRKGGVTTILYGGNSALYHVSIRDFTALCAMMAELADPDALVIPSIGPTYGKMMDEARVLRGTSFPTALLLPSATQVDAVGLQRGIRDLVDLLGRPILFYLNREDLLGPDRLARLVEEGAVAAIKYAVPREPGADDPFLVELLRVVDRRVVVSGLGELPALEHLRDFGLAGFTSGLVALAPRTATAYLAAMRAGDWQRAAGLRRAFEPLERLRRRVDTTRVLHDAVTLSGIADMGPLIPLLSNLPDAERSEVAALLPPLRRLEAELA